MSTTETTRVDGPADPEPAATHDAAAEGGSIWGAPPSAAGSASSTETVTRGSGTRRFPELVKTKVAALLAAAGVAVGGVAGVAVGHTTAGGGQQVPAGFTSQNGQTGQGGPGGFGQGGPGTQQGQSGTQPGQSGTLPDGSAAQGSTGTTT